MSDPQFLAGLVLGSTFGMAMASAVIAALSRSGAIVRDPQPSVQVRIYNDSLAEIDMDEDDGDGNEWRRNDPDSEGGFRR